MQLTAGPAGMTATGRLTRCSDQMLAWLKGDAGSRKRLRDEQVHAVHVDEVGISITLKVKQDENKNKSKP